MRLSMSISRSAKHRSSFSLSLEIMLRLFTVLFRRGIFLFPENVKRKVKIKEAISRGF